MNHVICRQVQSGDENRLHEDPQMRQQHNREYSVQVPTHIFLIEFFGEMFLFLKIDTRTGII
jgi:hypothetical protein